MYARVPGFELHGHAVTVSKSKKKKSEKISGSRKNVGNLGSSAKSLTLDSVPESTKGKIKPTSVIESCSLSLDASGTYQQLPQLDNLDLSVTASSSKLHSRKQLRPPFSVSALYGAQLTFAVPTTKCYDLLHSFEETVDYAEKSLNAFESVQLSPDDEHTQDATSPNFVQKQKKKSQRVIDVREGTKKRDALPARPKLKRGTLLLFIQ